MEGFVERLTGARRDEVRPLCWSAAGFFLLMAAWYVLRPIRDAMGIAGGTKKLPWLFWITLAGTLVLAPLLAALVSHLPRRRVVLGAYHGFALSLLGFCGLLWRWPGAGPARAFFVWASVLNLFAVSLFWQRMADRWRTEQGARLFGMVAVGGTLGAMAGAGATTLLVGRLGPYGLMLGAVALLEGAALCLSRVDGGGEERALPGGGAVAAIARVFSSPYLAAIAGYLLLYTITGTGIYLTQEEIVAHAVKDRSAQVALFARIDLWVNLLSLAAQLFATGRLLRVAGVTATLVVLPVVTLLGLGAVGRWPLLSVIVAVQVVRRTVDYAAARPARELLFTAAGKEDKYKAKGFIDTFVYRGGDALGGALFDGLSRLVGAMGVVAALVPVALGWAGLAVALGRMEAKRARDQPG